MSIIGLVFPVQQVDKMLRNGGFADRVGETAPVYLAAEYKTAEVLDLSVDMSKKKKKP